MVGYSGLSSCLLIKPISRDSVDQQALPVYRFVNSNATLLTPHIKAGNDGVDMDCADHDGFIRTVFPTLSAYTGQTVRSRRTHPFCFERPNDNTGDNESLARLVDAA